MVKYYSESLLKFCIRKKYKVTLPNGHIIQFDNIPGSEITDVCLALYKLTKETLTSSKVEIQELPPEENIKRIIGAAIHTRNDDSETPVMTRSAKLEKRMAERLTPEQLHQLRVITQLLGEESQPE